ncbi:cysteine desulfurase/selenocysteine lyase [Methylomarinovum caldicuralii]|uniref:Cysteine desulfurase/selenocysteine lyase n=1 Tax=Methylomarinovum caldicuralii TaxID=438856 RepID=A0AAU9CGX6_9GAMM|nr:aminotransferase class V-fold PLP-dependent enzyme [Methylomarinovum caldicuralii]BCX82235.1 cysteine desulfurase/selenocysteine lyase [Methylomarinovum caldicuralii]
MSHPAFALDPDLIYLNHAGVGPWPRRTQAAVAAFAEENARQGAACYPAWLQVEARLRRRLKALLNAPSSDDIALVKNTSEAISFVAMGLVWREGDNVVTSNEEFPSNRIPWEALRSRGVELRQADLAAGKTAEEALFALVDRRTRLLTVSSVQYATGRRMDLERIGEFCRRRGLLFCVDAIQSLGALRADVQAWQADFVMADGHKWLLAPEGLGLFYTMPEARDRLQLLEYGWHMVEHAGDYDRRDWRPAASARRFECGSPNMLGIFALEASLALLQETGMETVERQVLANAAWLIERIQADPDLELLTPSDRHAGIVTFRPRQGDPARLFEQLRRRKVICALRGGGIRFSPHFHNDTGQLDRALSQTTLSLR